MTIQGLKNYQLEGSEAGRWKFNIVKGKELLNNATILAIQNFDKEIYFNDTDSRHWIFDFKILDNWIEASKIDCNNMEMDLIITKL